MTGVVPIPAFDVSYRVNALIILYVFIVVA